MTLDVAETVKFFGFDRTTYSNLKMRRKWRWYKELIEESKRHTNSDALILVEKEFLVLYIAHILIYIVGQ